MRATARANKVSSQNTKYKIKDIPNKVCILRLYTI